MFSISPNHEQNTSDCILCPQFKKNTRTRMKSSSIRGTLQSHEANTPVHPVSYLISLLFYTLPQFSISILLYCFVYLYIFPCCNLCKFHNCLLLGCKVMPSGRQLEHMDAEAVIIGGMVLDIHATPSIHANPGTTTPGKVSYVIISYEVWTLTTTLLCQFFKLLSVSTCQCPYRVCCPCTCLIDHICRSGFTFL
jgi:hypothetical protein